MSLEQVIVAIVVALIGAASGMWVEKTRVRREQQKEITSGAYVLRQAEITDESSKRKEIEDAARDVRNFLRQQIKELNEGIEKLETARTGEHEKWRMMLEELSIKNLDLELQHRKDVRRIEEMMEEAKVIDDEVKNLKTRITLFQSEAIIMSAKLSQAIADANHLRKDSAIIKGL